MASTSNGGVRPRRAALVVNTRSRTGQQTFREARERLVSLGVPLDAAYAMHDPGRIPETVRGALNDGCDLVVVGGGDGTVSSVVDFLADQHAVLGLLPLGTANDFARTLQIPADVGLACETVAKGRLVDVDLGLAGDNYFVNVASVGLAVDVTGALSPRLKKRAGSLAYPVAALKAFLRHTPFTARLTFPDGDHEPMQLDNLMQVAVGNGRFYGGGNVVAPDAGIDDQSLDVYAIQRGRHRDLLGVARHFKSGHFVHKENVIHVTTTRVELEAEPVQSLNIDGEVVARTPQHLSVAHNALRVLVPQGSGAASLDTEVPVDR